MQREGDHPGSSQKRGQGVVSLGAGEPRRVRLRGVERQREGDHPGSSRVTRGHQEEGGVSGLVSAATEGSSVSIYMEGTGY